MNHNSKITVWKTIHSLPIDIYMQFTYYGIHSALTQLRLFFSELARSFWVGVNWFGGGGCGGQVHIGLQKRHCDSSRTFTIRYSMRIQYSSETLELIVLNLCLNQFIGQLHFFSKKVRNFQKCTQWTIVRGFILPPSWASPLRRSEFRHERENHTGRASRAAHYTS